MTTRALAEMRHTLEGWEVDARQAQNGEETDEQRAARTAVRQLVAARLAVERWLMLRAMHGALAQQE